ncbi:unnamed protein product, partial [Symbiodinium microadriaticum]
MDGMDTQANAIGGRNEKAVKEFLEKNWSEGLAEEQAVRLSIKALMEDGLEVLIADIEREAEESKKASQDAAADE